MTLKTRHFLLFALSLFPAFAIAPENPLSIRTKLMEWRTGVWINSGGYSIYTSTHYFIISANGNPKSPDAYCGASQLAFTDKGIAWQQNIRVRLSPISSPQIDFAPLVNKQNQELPMTIDQNQFRTKTCHSNNYILYSPVTEITENGITLQMCNGDSEKIFSDGRSVYLPAGGGEIWSYRIEKFQ
jgi:hypothetical protein